MLYVDQTAKTEEEALELACRKMRLDKTDVVVRSVRDVPDGVVCRIEAVVSRGQDASAILEAILEKFSIKTELFYIEHCDKILINLKGPHLGLIIGKAGSTLEALETIIGAMHNREHSMYKPVVINPGGYRENKIKALKILVRSACNAAENGEKVSLPIMRQRERKQVHQLVKDFPGFRSKSVGDGSDRRVMVFRESDEDVESEGNMPDETEFIPPVTDADPNVGADDLSI